MKNIILDFGGVIYQISHEKQKEAFANFEIENFDSLYSHAVQSPLFADLEKGLISNQDFRIAIRAIIGKQVSDGEIDYLWNSILIGFFEDSVELLTRLRKKYNLFILSNTNSLHYKVFIKEFFDKYGYDFNGIFVKTFWSFQMGLRKPNTDIFQFVMQKNGFGFDDTVFVDDTKANILAAEAVGIQSVMLNNGEKLSDLFREDLSLKPSYLKQI
jgi:FMN phosphatase YigB (HAD superfamily)